MYGWKIYKIWKLCQLRKLWSLLSESWINLNRNIIFMFHIFVIIYIYIFASHLYIWICINQFPLEASYHITSTLYLIINLLNPLSFQSLYKENGALSISHCHADFPLFLTKGTSGSFSSCLLWHFASWLMPYF